MKPKLNRLTPSFIPAVIFTIWGCSTPEADPPSTNTLIIGEQEWTTRNLDVGIFSNGDTIPEARTEGEWIAAWREGKPAWCYYDNDPANGAKYGRIYNRYAVDDPRGLAPSGWRIATDDDFSRLFRSAGDRASIRLKSRTGWNEEGNGTDSLGFCALPAGSRYGNGKFYGNGDYAVFGTSGGGNVYLTKFGGLRGGSGRGFGRNGLYLRCVRRKMYDGFDIVPSGVSNPGILFVNNEATGNSGHSGSAMTECTNGDILAFYAKTSGIIHGGHTTPGWTEYRRSTDGGNTWGDPVVLPYSKEVWDQNASTDGGSYNSSLVMSATTAPNGNILIITPNWWFSKPPNYLISRDNGRTWSDARPIDEHATGMEVGRHYDRSIFVHEGAIYAFFMGGRFYGPVSCYVSEDNAETFTLRANHLFAGRTYRNNSFYLTASVLDDGTFIVYCYQDNDEHYGAYVTSRDRGHTWSDVRYAYFEKKIRNPEMSEKIGDYYFLHGRTGNRGFDSGSFVLYKSEDGINWDCGVYLNRGEGVASPGSDAYSANALIGRYDDSRPLRLLIQSSISYDASRVNLKHWWITNVSGTETTVQ